MSTTRVWLMLVVTSFVVLAVGFGSRIADSAQARSYAREASIPGITVPYPGRLADATGQSVTDGFYDLSFALYEAETGGEPLWSEVQGAIAVADGAFLTSLGAINPISPAVLEGCTRWLAVGIRGPGEASFAALNPRQQVAAAMPGEPAVSAGGAPCPHNHWGETWDGAGPGLTLRSSSGPGLFSTSASTDGVHGEASAANKSGVFGLNHGAGFGVFGRSDSGPGVAGHSAKGDGVSGHSDAADGVHGESANGPGVRGETSAADGVGVVGTNLASGNYGELGTGNEGLHAVAFNQGGAGVFAQSAKGPAVHADGDLVVSGAYRGSIGPDGGAPFPRPAYDSGWQSISKGGTRVFNHGIGGNRDNYVVDMQFKDNGGNVHNYLYGAMTWSEYLGAWWTDLTNQQIIVERMKDDAWVLQVRVRIWVYH